MTDFQNQIRSLAFRAVVLLAFIILAGRLWNLQVSQGAFYAERADQNRFRNAPIPASRGIMYDRDGNLLVRNRALYNVQIIPNFLPEDTTAEARIYARLSELLNLPITTQIEPSAGYNNGHFQAITHHQYNRQLNRQIVNPRSRRYINVPQGIRDAVQANRFIAPFRPITIAEDVDPFIISMLEEERINLPGVFIEIESIRDYAYSQLLGPIIGYTGPIPAEQLPDYEEDGYQLTDVIGLTGLEIEYEALMRGTKGLENIEIDATGQKVRTIELLEAAIPGNNLKLSLDMDLQQATADALQEMMDEVESNQGVAIAMNPNTGEILAMVSLPSYDNNLFSRGISPRELALLSEDPWTPLINHAISGFYPPGSTFKIVPAAGSLQERTVQPNTIFYDEGTLYLPNQFAPDNRNLDQPFFCWLRSGHEEVNAVLALTYSCNVYYYQIAGGYYPEEYEGLGLERLVDYALMFGYGAPTGIDLPAEGAGLIPDARWKRLNHAERWLTGDTYNMSVGQGFVLATPLQVLNSFAAIANGGTLYKPYLVQEVLDPAGQVLARREPEPIQTLQLDTQFERLIQQGLRGVVMDENGTAFDDFDVPGLDAAGKTGTAEFCDEYPQCIDRNGRVQTKHAWFASYAPTNAPEIVTVVFVYGGGEGSATAVPVTSKILRHYFGLQNEDEDDGTNDDERLTDEDGRSPSRTFAARFLGSDRWLQPDGFVYGTASVSGFVFGVNHQGLEGVTIEILADGQLYDQVVSGEIGQFRYDELNVDLAENWQFRLAGYTTESLLDLKIANGLRYLVEFEQLSNKTEGNVG